MGSDWRADRKYQFPQWSTAAHPEPEVTGGGSSTAASAGGVLPDPQRLQLGSLAVSPRFLGWCSCEPLQMQALRELGRGVPGPWRGRASLGCCAGTGKPGMGEASAPPSSRKVQSKWKYFPSNTGNPQSLLCFPSQLCEISCNLAVTLNFSSFYCVAS